MTHHGAMASTKYSRKKSQQWGKQHNVSSKRAEDINTTKQQNKDVKTMRMSTTNDNYDEYSKDVRWGLYMTSTP